MRVLQIIICVFFVHCAYTQVIIRDIKSFGARGDGKTNDHDAFQRAAEFFNKRGGNGKLIISKGMYIIGKQTSATSSGGPAYVGSDALPLIKVKNFGIEGLSGAYIKYANGLRFGAFDPKTGLSYQHGNNYFVNPPYVANIGRAISFTDCSQVYVKNLDLNGNLSSIVRGGVYGDQGIQIPHIGITIDNSTSVTVQGVKAHHFGLDGIMVSNHTNSTSPEKILIQNSSFEYNARQGLSWIGGNDLTVIGCKFNHTGRMSFTSAPGAGVDIEAEVGPVLNGNFRDCEFIDNAGNGLVADTGPSSNCTFANCTFWGVTGWSIWVTKPGFTFNSCKIYGSMVHGFDANTDQEATKFINCWFEDKPYEGKGPYGNFLIETNYKRRVTFTGCTMFAHKKKVVWMESNPSWSPEEKYQLFNCHLIYTGDSWPKGDFISLTRNIRYRNCTFEIRNGGAQKKGYYFNGLGESYNVNLGGSKVITE